MWIIHFYKTFIFFHSAIDIAPPSLWIDLWSGETSERWFLPEMACPHLKIREYYHNVFHLICIGITDQIRIRSLVWVRFKARSIFPWEKKGVWKISHWAECTRLYSDVAQYLLYEIFYIVTLWIVIDELNYYDTIQVSLNIQV